MKLAVRGIISRRQDRLIGVAGVGALVLLWCVVTYGHIVQPIFLPTPAGIANGFVTFYQKHLLFPAIWQSFWRVFRALLLVVGIGVPLGILMGAFPAADAFLRKIVNGAKSVPTTGIIGLILLWFGFEERGKTAFLFMGAFFYMVILVKNAVTSVNEEYVRVAMDLGARPGQVIRRVLLPGALPQIWEAIAVCNGIMWTYIVLAEYISHGPNDFGLGILMQVSSRTNEPGQVFATLLLIAMISVATDYGLHAVRRKVFNW
jgi:NitT/TauT family transport system permease protein